MNNKRSTTHGGWSQRLRFLLSALALLAFGIGLSAQTVQVTGTVYEPSGEPVIGASVIEQGVKTAPAAPTTVAPAPTRCSDEQGQR